MEYVIIGNSYASAFAIESIRKKDLEGKITVISREPYHIYARAALHDYMSGKIGDREMYYREPDFYKKYNVNPLLGETVEGVDHRRQILYLNRGKTVHYDKLLISSGSLPLIPPIKGTEGIKGVFTFMSWDDAKKIMMWVKNIKNPTAVVLGGGLIGIQCAEGLKEIGVDVTIVELAEYVLVRALDRNAGKRVERLLNMKGIKVITSDTVESVTSVKGRVSGVTLKSGEKLSCNLFVIAIGVRPNTEFLKDSGIKVNKGILVDKKLRTNFENIYAAGDVAEAVELISGKSEVIPIIPSATLQGKIAGANMAGEERDYPGTLSQNIFQFSGIPVVSMGNLFEAEKGDGHEILIRENEDVYKKAVISNGRLIYFISFGSLGRIGILKNIIRMKIDVTDFKEKILEDNFGFLSLPKSLRKDLLSKPGGIWV